MLPDKNVMCPATAFEKSCFKCVTEFNCPKWVRMTGVHPQTGQTVDTYDCVDRWLPALMTANSQEQRATCAAVEQLRNLVAAVNSHIPNEVLESATQMKLING